MTDNNREEIRSADLEIEGSSDEAPRQGQEDCTAEPQEPSEDIDLEESDDVEESGNCHVPVDHANPWTVTLGRCANLVERQKIVNEGKSLKERRRAEADSGQYPTIDPEEVKTHSRFKELLGIDEDLEESISADMAVEGYKLSQPIVLGTWPGQEEPVLIDGHTRVKSAIRSGTKKIPYAIERFGDIDGALRYVATVQAKRRPTDQWVLYQLIIAVDSPMDRGGDRRSDEAKSKGPNGPIEKQYKNSAQRTAAIVNTNETTVKRARRIHREGTPDIVQALKEGKMTISQAEKAIIEKAKAKAEKETGEESPVPESENSMVQVNGEYREVLSQMEGTLHEHVNKAVKMYIRWLRDKGRLPKEYPSEQ